VDPTETVPDDSAPTEALKDAFGQISELRAYAVHYISAKADQIRLTIRKAGIYAVLGIIGLMAGAALVMTAVVLLCVGLAGALSAWIGTGIWAGSLIVGGFVMLVLGAGIGWLLWWFPRASRARTVQKYEDKRRQQQADYGHDVHERAREQDRSRLAGG
jgi:hypothetical protein